MRDGLRIIATQGGCQRAWSPCASRGGTCPVLRERKAPGHCRRDGWLGQLDGVEQARVQWSLCRCPHTGLEALLVSMVGVASGDTPQSNRAVTPVPALPSIFNIIILVLVRANAKGFAGRSFQYRPVCFPAASSWCCAVRRRGSFLARPPNKHGKRRSRLAQSSSQHPLIPRLQARTSGLQSQGRPDRCNGCRWCRQPDFPIGCPSMGCSCRPLGGDRCMATR